MPDSVEIDQVAEVIALHQRVSVKAGHPCYCGQWPTGEVGQPGWHEHVAQALAAAGLTPGVSTRRTDWGVRDDATGNVGTVGAYGREATERWLDELTEPSTLMRRERTTYRDNVTEWTEADR